MRFACLLLVVLSGVLEAQDVEPDRNLRPPRSTGLTPPLKTDDRIALYEKRVASDLKNVRYQTQLAAAYIQKTRETTDSSYLDRAAKIIDNVLAHEKQNYEAWRLRNLVELNRHNFAKVAEYAREMAKMAPQDAQNWGTLGDALMELGEYEDGGKAYRTMMALRPSLFSYNRAGYYRFITGDADGAIAMMSEAVALGSSYPENKAWCLVELGNLYFKTGRWSEAERAYTSAISTFPGTHSGYAGLGSVQAAQGQLQAAIESYKRAQAAVPMVQYAAALSDLYQFAGMKAEARRQAELIDMVARMEEAANRRANRTLALVYANQDRNLTRALELAQADLAIRKDVYTYDVLAWVLFKNKKYDEAQNASERALKMATPEPLFYYHAGMVAHALDRDRDAERHLERALSLNPKFDLGQAALAERTLRDIRLKARHIP